MNLKKKTSKGITLIALVISIIVLLILAGVTINALSGDNGLLKRAAEAKDKNQSAKIEEQRQLTIMEANTNLGEITYNNVKIPAGMAVSQVEGENTLEKGLVAIDKKGNEWVWIEVPKSIYTDATYTAANSNNSVTSSTDYTGIYNIVNKYAESYRKGKVGQDCNWTDEWYDKYGTTYDGTNEYSQVKYITDSDKYNAAKAYYGKIYTDRGTTEATSYASETKYYAKVTEKITDTSGCGLTYDQYQTTYKKMLSSVYTNGGFWIGRYEAGVSNTTPRSAAGAITGLEAKSQKDMYPFNFVTCSQAQTLSNAMSPDSSKTSSLMFGIQWDLVCKFLEGKDGLTIANINSISTNWGNYNNIAVPITSSNAKQRESDGTWSPITGIKAKDSSILLSTGASNNTKKMNIYDFAGNEWEWTLEHATSNTNYPCAIRGGNYNNNGSNNPASNRNYNTTYYSDDSISFRAALY